MKTVAIAGTFDSKGTAFLYIKNLFESIGISTMTIHTGVFEPEFEPDIPNDAIFEAAGKNKAEIVAKEDRAEATAALAEGMEILVPELYREGRFDGIISCGGSGGTALVSHAMRALPIGVPKIIVSTLASGNVEKYIGSSDIIMMPSIVDVSGINCLSTTIFSNAVFAMAGMLKNEKKEAYSRKPLVAATMFGVTTSCVEYAKTYLEACGYEVLVFHCTGIGGKTMEILVQSGLFKGVLDLTTTEWCDEVVGGDFPAGPHRCEAAARCEIPQVVSVGALDMVNFGEFDTIEDKYKDRNLYHHNPEMTLMRTTKEECIEIGKNLARKWNQAQPDKISVYIPLQGVSMIDAKGQPFYGPEEDAALFSSIKKGLRPEIEVVEMRCHINDQEFALAAAQRLVEMMETSE